MVLTTMQETSVSLIQRLSAGGGDLDWHALDAMYRPFIVQQLNRYPSLTSYGDDIAQEVMMILMKELPTFERERPGSFRVWLRNITVNQLRNAVRKRKRDAIATGDSPEFEAIELLADPASLFAKKWDAEHDNLVLQQAMSNIRAEYSPTDWVTFDRYALKQESPASVAVSLGITVNQVYLVKSRITARLRSEVNGLVDQ